MQRVNKDNQAANIEKKVEKRLEDIKMKIEMKMEMTSKDIPPYHDPAAHSIYPSSISESERRRLANLDEEIIILGKELEDLKTQTIDDFHSDEDDDLDECHDRASDPFVDHEYDDHSNANNSNSNSNSNSNVSINNNN